MEFLSQAPEPPAQDAVQLALGVLKEVGAVELDGANEKLSALGRYLSRIPLHVRLGKMLIFGAIFKCLDPVLTIVAGLSCKSPFVTALNDATEASARKKAFQHEHSDFLTICNVWDAFHAECKTASDRGRRYCSSNYLSWTALMEIRDIRNQSLELLAQIGFVPSRMNGGDVGNSNFNSNGTNENVVQSVLCAGLYPNISHVVHESISDPPRLWHGKEQLHFHKSSVNFQKRRLPSEWIMFHEKFATGRTTVSVTSPVNAIALILFGGKVVVKHVEREVVVDEWIVLGMAAQTGVMLRALRGKLDNVLQSKIEQVDGSEDSDDLIDGIIQLLAS
mmetsp:Transcript_1878/g.3299  ORF Transcript_1878/g.3299 Transcript_1878/m.3299 type:complete len:334 (+) Transcript_1878:299-1300(+)